LQNAPPALARLVRRCLEKKPERRVQRTEILLAELKLQEILARPLIPARPEAATRDHSGPAAEVKPARFQRRFATRLSMRS
jgi:hypothetical protein